MVPHRQTHPEHPLVVRCGVQRFEGQRRVKSGRVGGSGAGCGCASRRAAAAAAMVASIVAVAPLAVVAPHAVVVAPLATVVALLAALSRGNIQLLRRPPMLQPLLLRVLLLVLLPGRLGYVLCLVVLVRRLWGKKQQ